MTPVLNNATTTLEVKLSAAVTTSELDIYATYLDYLGTDEKGVGGAPAQTATNGTTAVTVVTGAANTRREVSLTVTNIDTAPATVTVQVNNGVTTTVIKRQTLAVGDSLSIGGSSAVDEKKNEVLSSLNTTTVPLGPSIQFLGTGDQADYPDVGVSCYSDTAGTLYFEFSNDNSNWDIFPSTPFSVAAGIHEFHTAVKLGRYFRARFVNSGTAQTEFRLYTYFGTYRQPSAPLNQPLSLDADAILVRPSFDWLDVARGLTSGIRVVKKFGNNQAIGTSFTPVCSAGVYQVPTSAVALEFISSSTDDALNDTGAHEITVVGLDANWEEQTVATAAHATDGTTAVNISGTWLRVFRAYVSKSGAYASSTTGSHIGTITIRVQGGGATYGTIPVVDSFPMGQSLIGAYTIPSGYTGFVFLTSLSIDTGKTVNAAFFARENADDTSSTYDGTMRVKSILTGLTGGSFINRTGARVPLGPYEGPTDVGWMALVSTGTAEVSVEFEIFLVQNQTTYAAVTPGYAYAETSYGEIAFGE